MILSNIFTLILVIFFLFIISIRLAYFSVETRKLGETNTNVLATILFLLSLGAVLPRLCVWLF